MRVNFLLLTSNPSCTSPDLLHSPFFGKGCSRSPVTILSFCMNDHVVSTDSANCWCNFCPVTWHHQRRPFVRVLACKTRKTRRGLAGRASSDDQVSQVFVRKGEKERERELERIIDSNTPFYTPVCYMSILPLSSTRFHVDVLYHRWLVLTGLINIEGWNVRPRLRSKVPPESGVKESL